jgi:hypothetical protein
MHYPFHVMQEMGRRLLRKLAEGRIHPLSGELFVWKRVGVQAGWKGKDSATESGPCFDGQPGHNGIERVPAACLFLVPSARAHPDQCLGVEVIYLLGFPDETENRRRPGAPDHAGDARGTG